MKIGDYLQTVRTLGTRMLTQPTGGEVYYMNDVRGNITVTKEGYYAPYHPEYYEELMFQGTYNECKEYINKLMEDNYDYDHDL